MDLRSRLAAVLGVPVLVLWFFSYIQWLIWLLPLLLAFVIVKWLSPSRSPSLFAFFLMSSAGAALCGPWVLLLVHIAPGRPEWLHWLLAGYYTPEGHVPLGFLSMFGLVCFLVYCAMYAIARSALERSGRIWALRLAIVLIAGGGVLMVHRFQPSATYSFGFLAYLLGIGPLLGTPDPHSVVFELSP